MSTLTPALRQPKSLNKIQKPPSNLIITDSRNVILTLKDCRKLVIPSDSYHGILMAGNLYKCVFCSTEIELNSQCKEAHMSTQQHLKCMEQHPHLEEYSENLLRKVLFYINMNCHKIIHNHHHPNLK